MEQDAVWQQRIRDLYTNVQELYAHIDVTVIVFDRKLAEVSGNGHDFGAALMDTAREVLATGEPRRDVALDATGRQRLHAVALRDADAIIGVVCVVDDDGARRELFVRCAMAIFDGYRHNEVMLLERERLAVEEARRATQLRDQFLAVVAHELRSPMSSILLWEEVLRSPAIDDATRTLALDAIHESATGQAQLVADLLDVSRAINGKLHIDHQATSVGRVLAMALDDARPSARARHLEIVTHVAPDLGNVLGDPRRLRQVFDNLLSNAVKCTARGRIEARASQTDDEIVVEISDTGRGIAPGFLPHLFEPFRQADEGGTDEGLGLGLGIARQLVELHGGTLTAASDGLERGARFTVRLPRLGLAAQEPISARASITGVRVLVVDDDRHILDALGILLARAGAEVKTAASVADARAVLELGSTDVVVTDLCMPGENGYDLVRRLRVDGAATPVIAMTARVTADGNERALAAGFDRYLTKPLDTELMVASIAALAR